jgi:6-phosphogluconolactonase/glucosamine-6-phosphate isomerase/deaminase
MTKETNDNIIKLAVNNEDTETEDTVEEVTIEHMINILQEELKPVNLVMIGLTEDGHPFIMDSTQSVANTAYMTDMAKNMLFQRQVD